MPEVNRALVVPDVMLVTSGLKTLALSWDEIVVPVYPAEYGVWLKDRDDGIVEALVEAGVLRFVTVAPDKNPFLAATGIEKLRVGAEWARHPEATTSSMLPPEARQAILRARGDRAADVIAAGVRYALRYGAENALAPVCVSPFAQMCAALPEEVPGLPQREAALISISINCVSIDPATPVEDVLAFREKESALLGRLRASLIDLRAQIEEAQTPTAVFNQAEAVIKNRVEPALGDLDLALRSKRIAFIWRSLIGVAGLAALGPMTPHGLGRSAQAFGRAIHYAFDREALVREHPFGYLHLARTSLGTDEAPDAAVFGSKQQPIESPTIEIRDLFRTVSTALSADSETGPSQLVEELIGKAPSEEMRSKMGELGFTQEELAALDEAYRRANRLPDARR